MFRQRIIGHIISLSLIFVFCGDLLAQKVGVVLSGGGAKGLSHVGVLKALEENEIPVDFIAGTSMGAVIGGLYASGYSPEDIEEFIREDAVDQWITGELESEYIYFFKQSPQDASWVNINFSYDPANKKIESRLPTNIISPHQLEFAFLELFSAASAASDYDFDNLMVPFRCVAADIDSSKAVVFSDGQLGPAIRASTTFPFFFKPITIDDKLLFDGGIYNNFPVDIMIDEFDPDFIIGIKAVSNYPQASSEDVISQLQNMITSKTDYSIPGDKGIVIEPILPELSNVIDMSKKGEIIDSGYYAALRAMPGIISQVNRRVSREEVKKKRDEFREKEHPIIIDSISIKGLSAKGQKKYIMNSLKHDSPYLTLEKMKMDYFRLLADDKVKYIFPTLVFNDSSGYFDMSMDIERDDQFVIGLGGNISSLAASTAFLGLQYRYFGGIGLDINVNGYFGQFYSSAHGDMRLDLPSKLPFFFGIYYTYNHKDYFRTQVYFFEDKEPSYLVQNENHFGFQLGFPATRSGRIVSRFAAGYTKDNYYQNNTFTRIDTADVTYFDFITPDLRFEINSLNNRQYANKGVKLMMLFKYINGKEKTIPGSTSENKDEIHESYDWVMFKLLYDNYFRDFGFLTLGFYGELLLSNQPVFSNYTATILRTPIFAPIPEMNLLFLPNYRAQNYAAVGLKAIFNIYKPINFRLEGYLFQPYEELSQNDSGDAVKQKQFSFRSYIVSGTFVYHSPFGPVSLALNYYDRAEESFSVFFNIGFIIFNGSAFD